MQQYITEKVIESQLRSLPYEHVVIDDFLPNLMYEKYASARIATEFFTPLSHRQTLCNNQPTRYEFQLNTDTLASLPMPFEVKQFWSDIIKGLIAESFIEALQTKLGITTPVAPSIVLYRDFGGFELPPHTDIPEKKITLGLYLPQSTLQQDLGFQILTKHGDGFIQASKVAFLPNKAFFFKVSDKSWHCAANNQVGFERNSLFVHYYDRTLVREAIMLKDKNVERSTPIMVSC